jgi:hypothetical protein
MQVAGRRTRRPRFKWGSSWHGRCSTRRRGSIMTREDFRFFSPETPEGQLAQARARVQERRAGLKLMGALFGGSAFVAGVIAVVARLVGGMAQRWLPVVSMLTLMAGAGLVIVGASALVWRGRLRQLTRRIERGTPTGSTNPSATDAGEQSLLTSTRLGSRAPLTSPRRNSNERPDLRSRHRSVLRGGSGLHPRLREALRRSS